MPEDTLRGKANYIRRTTEQMKSMLTKIGGYAGDLFNSASIDPLTGVHSSQYIGEQGELETGRLGIPNDKRKKVDSLSLLWVDIDQFKKYNDRFGDEGGDRILRNVGRLLKYSVRKTDSVGRYSGGADNFLVILRGTDESGALKTAEKIKGKFQGKLQEYVRRAGKLTNMKQEDLDELERLTIRIGWATTDSYIPFKELIYRAGQNCQEAKSRGGNMIYPTL